MTSSSCQALGIEMSGIDSAIFTAVCQIRVQFLDGVGDQKNIIGTGFWVSSDSWTAFITNKHNVDPTLKLGNDTDFRLHQIQIQMRRSQGRRLFAETAFFIVNDALSVLRMHTDADVAVLLNPKIDAPGYGFNWFAPSDLATPEFLSSSVSSMDIASFIGFPGRNGRPWWDEQWQVPVARVVNIASWPAIPFTNSGIKTDNVSLVSGLSFSGSSGSPVILHEKGVRVGAGLTGGNYVSPKILGIMSGHWWGQEPAGDMFFHSGLSYFTRAPAILEVLNA